jgi:hypothetical protein
MCNPTLRQQCKLQLYLANDLLQILLEIFFLKKLSIHLSGTCLEHAFMLLIYFSQHTSMFLKSQQLDQHFRVLIILLLISCRQSAQFLTSQEPHKVSLTQ